MSATPTPAAHDDPLPLDSDDEIHDDTQTHTTPPTEAPTQAPDPPALNDVTPQMLAARQQRRDRLKPAAKQPAKPQPRVSPAQRVGAAASKPRADAPRSSLGPLKAAAAAPSARSARKPAAAANATAATSHDVTQWRAQIAELKNALYQASQENKVLRVAATRSEAEARRAELAAEEAALTTAIFDLGVPASTASSGGHDSMAKALKAQVRDLQKQVREREAELTELSASAKSARLRELQVQARTYYGEARRLQALVDAAATRSGDAAAALEAKHAAEAAAYAKAQEALKEQVAALDDELGRWMDENDQLREKVADLEKRVAASGPREKEARAKERAVREEWQAGVERRLRAEFHQQLREKQDEATTLLEAEKRALQAERSKFAKLERMKKKVDEELAEANSKLKRYEKTPE